MQLCINMSADSDLSSLFPSAFSTIAQSEINRLGFNKHGFDRDNILLTASSGNEASPTTPAQGTSAQGTSAQANVEVPQQQQQVLANPSPIAAGQAVPKEEQDYYYVLEEVPGANMQVEPTSSSLATRANPSMEDYPGELGFDVRVPPPVKSKDAQYSPKLNKLFINRKKTVHVFFKVRNAPDMAVPIKELRIRALAVYTRPDDFHSPVKVCVQHSGNT